MVTGKNASFIGDISSVILPGSSVADTISSFQSMDYSVKYKVEIENFSDQPLELVRSEIHSGYLHNPPPPVIMPGKKESYSAHKGSGATGAIGTVGYRIGGSNNVVAISISCPYNFNLASNTLAVGIYQWNTDKINQMTENYIYNKMQIPKIYPGKEVNKGESLTLKETTKKLLEQPKSRYWAGMKRKLKGSYVPVERKDFYYDAIPIQANDEAGKYLILGTMGTNHKPTVRISLFSK